MPKSLYKGIVLDFDGVMLPKSERINIAAAVKTFADLGSPLTETEMAFVPGKSTSVYVPHFLDLRGLPLAMAPEIIRQGRANYDAIWPADATMESTLPVLLSQLTKRRFAIAIATSNRRTTIDRFISLMLAGYNPFNAIVTGEDVKKHKPDPEVYTIAASMLGIDPQRLLAVEDTAIGVEAAKRAGMRCAAMPNCYSEDQNFDAADYRISSLIEILDLV